MEVEDIQAMMGRWRQEAAEACPYALRGHEFLGICGVGFKPTCHSMAYFGALYDNISPFKTGKLTIYQNPSCVYTNHDRYPNSNLISMANFDQVVWLIIFKPPPAV
jgi:hypothetical protein